MWTGQGLSKKHITNHVGQAGLESHSKHARKKAISMAPAIAAAYGTAVN